MENLGHFWVEINTNVATIEKCPVLRHSEVSFNGATMPAAGQGGDIRHRSPDRLPSDETARDKATIRAGLSSEFGRTTARDAVAKSK